MKPIPLVYFVGSSKPGAPVKIGRSNSDAIHRRLKTLQTGHPYKLDFLFVMEGGHEQESNAHKTFADLRLNGEWFKRNKALDAVLAELQGQFPNWRDLLGLPHIRYDEHGRRLCD